MVFEYQVTPLPYITYIFLNNYRSFYPHLADIWFGDKGAQTKMEVFVL